jgi:hypothetical protein
MLRYCTQAFEEDGMLIRMNPMAFSRTCEELLCKIRTICKEHGNEVHKRCLFELPVLQNKTAAAGDGSGEGENVADNDNTVSTNDRVIPRPISETQVLRRKRVLENSY